VVKEDFAELVVRVAALEYVVDRGLSLLVGGVERDAPGD